MSAPIYLDYNATTPVAPEVADAIEPYLRENFGNPSSSHALGRRAHEAVELARAQVAALIGARSGEIIFTGCATEANNLAILGVARALRGRGRHLITSAVEHPSVAAPMGHLREEGWRVTVLPVDSTGRVALADLAAALREDAGPGDDTVLVSVMHANNEVGTLQPIAELAALAKGCGALFHTDSAQSTGLGASAELAQRRLPAIADRLRARRDDLHRRLSAAIPGLVLNGHPEECLPNTLNLSFPGSSGRELLARTPSVAASVGSACHEESDAVNGVLAAMGISATRALGAVRLSLGEPTTMDEIARAARALVAAWRGLAGGPRA